MSSSLTRNLVWNRACFGAGDGSKVGDTALAALLAFHGPAKNGGVLHALECLSADRLAAACAGFRYFGFFSVAAQLEEASSVVAEDGSFEDLEQEFNEQYWSKATDAALEHAFEIDYAARPEHYAPIQ